MTKSPMSTSITSCVAKPGYSAVENLQLLVKNGEAEAENDDLSSISIFSDAFELAKDVEKAYDFALKEDLDAISVFCLEGSKGAQEYDLPEFSTTLHTVSFDECRLACLENVYCTSFLYSKEESYSTHAYSVMNYTGIYTYHYWPCHLFMFGSGAASDVLQLNNLWEGTEVRI